MSRFVSATILAACLGVPVAAQADDCIDEIRSLFTDGPLDPFARPPHRQQLEIFGPDGAPLYTIDSIVMNPLRQISGIRDSGQFILMADRKTWMGPTMEGPWSDSGVMTTEDVAAAQQAVADSMAANLSEAECPGVVQTDNGARLHYRFRSQVDPHPARGDSWWGAMNTVWLDPDSRLPLHWEMTEHVASWHEGVKDETHVVTVTYDDTVNVVPPE